MPELSAAYIKQLFDYEPETGRLCWAVERGKIKPGNEISCKSGNGAIQVMIDGKTYKAHRVIWCWMTGKWPDDEIDHRDGDSGNNRFLNLREATSSQNKMNTKTRRNNSSGYKGVFLDKRDGTWYSHISRDGHVYYLGRFQTPEDARAAYVAAASKIHGEFKCLTR